MVVVKTHLFFQLCVIFALTFFVAVSLASPEDPDCGLNFTSSPYKPSGECIAADQENINEWDSFPTTRCCQNVLNFFSQALAKQAITQQGNLFLKKDQWEHCSGPFKHQPSVSIENCGFRSLYQGSTKCSSLSLTNVLQDDNFKDVRDKCTGFDSSFDDACRNCTGAIKSARDHYLDQFYARDNDTERATCVMAVVISVAATKLNDPSSIDDFFSCLPALNSLEKSNEDYIKIKYSLAKALIAIVLATFGMIMVIMLVKYVTRNSRAGRKLVLSKSKELASCPGLYSFSKAEIENAINFGDEKKFLGRGSAGQVFKGILPSGQVVAIKQIYRSNTSDSFTRELENLSRVRHPNLVCLFGCCIEDGEQYLVYEFCSAGNLAQHLLRKDKVLTWEQRVNILRDCALALRYLHNYIDGYIVHRDIKLTNILLTEDLQPKLSDFGLARMLGMEESKVFTDVRGTIGYMDPEYMSNAKLTCASDIYSFGIVTLQVLSGQKVIELDLDARDQLTRKAKDVSMAKRPLKDFEDPRLKGQLNSVDFESILQIAVLCVAKSSKGRPTIEVVFEEMDKVWKNTLSDKKAAEQSAIAAVRRSHSVGVIPV
ncbi:cysteine-rich receptor-like protein kinase 42 isoform X1 [Nicotiana tabacum]|uniref:Cysteine-rich receptor-like protein kinase 42 isoform X1 n=1 Tax=Nicotiana tabacum TaxID=4097 RepID=A0A1S4AY21_TOBAC|nr:PREDICTED: cysteine-rich receptor-like protein kinase 42 isoform X1 [Nicotiana tabacum]